MPISSGGVLSFLRTLRPRSRWGMLLSASTGFAGTGLDILSLGLLIPTIERITGASAAASESEAVRWIGRLFDLVGLEFSLGWMLAVIITAVFLRSATLLAQSSIAAHFKAQYEAELKRTTFGAFMGADWQFFLAQRTGHLNNILIMETNRAGIAYGNVNNAFGALVNIALYAGFALAISWQLTLTALAVTAVLTALFGLLSRVAYRLGRRSTEVNNDLAAELNETIGGAKMVKSQGLEKLAESRLDERINRRAWIDFLIGVNGGIFGSVTEFVFFGLMLAMVLFASRVIVLPAAVVLLFALLFFRTYQRSRAFQGALIAANSRLPSVWAVRRMAAEAESSTRRMSGIPIEALRQGVEFLDVSFAYRHRESILRSISFRIPAGSLVALVGPSGGGKTSIIDLTIGLLQPTAGQVLVDGTPLSQYDANAWRSKLAYVSQETFLLNDTIFRNIAWGQTCATQADVVEAANVACAREFIEALPSGYDTLVGDRGVLLSGGERQRLALARALFRKPDLLILDEATSELDNRVETEIWKNLERIRGRTTILLAAHRLSTVLSADHVYVIEGGRIVETGTASGLLAKRGVFYGLYHGSATH